MDYTVCLDIDIDSEEIISDKDLEKALKDLLESAPISISNVKILDIND